MGELILYKTGRNRRGREGDVSREREKNLIIRAELCFLGWSYM
jgi:hypothetical protein